MEEIGLKPALCECDCKESLVRKILLQIEVVGNRQVAELLTQLYNKFFLPILMLYGSVESVFRWDEILFRTFVTFSAHFSTSSFNLVVSIAQR